MDVVEFFQRSAGKWRSQRATHHLAFKRAEIGESYIQVDDLAADDPEIIALCALHDIDPKFAVSGSRVQWSGSMGWDKDGENHDGKTVFALIPDPSHPHQGRLLRDLGYAEIVPVVGLYHMDEDDGLVLTTEYDTMSSLERFWFAGPDMRLRSSTVKRFGGLSTASFCTETRLEIDLDTAVEPQVDEPDALEQTATPSQSNLAAKQEISKQHFSFLGW